MNLKYLPGLRTVKTTIAVAICFVTGYLLNRDPLFACIAAVICMQDSYEKTMQIGVYRFFGTVLGGMVGFGILAAALTSGASDWILMCLMAPFGCLLAIYLCNLTGLPGAVVICCVVYFSTLVNFSAALMDLPIYVAGRVLDTVAGIVVAIVVNRFGLPEQGHSAGKGEEQ